MVSRNSVAQSNTGIGNVMPNTEFVQMEMPCLEQCFPFPFTSLSAASHSKHIEMPDHLRETALFIQVDSGEGPDASDN
jgi:hypothetical protein